MNELELGAAFERFDLRLQQAVISAVVAIEGAGRLQDVPLTLRPSDPKAFGFSVSGFTIKEAQALVKAWVLRNAFENCIEDFALFVEDTMAILTNATGAERSTFNRRGFADKLEALRIRLGVTHRIRNLDCLLSLNDARNCLVHRGGVVGPKDVTDETTQSLLCDTRSSTSLSSRVMRTRSRGCWRMATTLGTSTERSKRSPSKSRRRWSLPSTSSRTR